MENGHSKKKENGVNGHSNTNGKANGHKKPNKKQQQQQQQQADDE